MAKLVLRQDQLGKFRRLASQNLPPRERLTFDSVFAARIGVDAGQVSRILRGKSAPGTKFIAGCLDLFGIECFADLFAVVPDDEAA